MLKEIYEQPEVISHTLGALCRFRHGADAAAGGRAARFPRACGGSRCPPAAPRIYAGLIGKYWFEKLARLPVDIDIASEFRYRETPLDPGGLALFISQSGETADTLAALRYCAERRRRRSAPSSTCRAPPSRARRIMSCRRLPGRRSASPPPRPSPASSPCSSRSPSRRRGSAARSRRRRRNAWSTRPSKCRAMPAHALKLEARDRGARQGARQGLRTSSISAAAPPIRWRSKAR